MAYNTTAELIELYFQQSRDSIKPDYHFHDSLLQWPANGYFDKFRSDAALLKQALAAYTNTEASTVAEQVFASVQEKAAQS